MMAGAAHRGPLRARRPPRASAACRPSSSRFDRRLERDVAVKLLAEHLAEDPQFVARFRREALAAARLVHPNIVQVFDFGLDEPTGRHYIVMEYIGGQSCAEILRDRGRPAGRARRSTIVAQACRGLDYAHRNGVVHRDVKPGNLLRSERRRRQARRLRHRQGGRATSRRSPRSARCSAPRPTSRPSRPRGEEAGPRADLYALGVVTYQLLSGPAALRGAVADRARAQAAARGARRCCTDVDPRRPAGARRRGRPRAGARPERPLRQRRGDARGAASTAPAGVGRPTSDATHGSPQTDATSASPPAATRAPRQRPRAARAAAGRPEPPPAPLRRPGPRPPAAAPAPAARAAAPAARLALAAADRVLAVAAAAASRARRRVGRSCATWHDAADQRRGPCASSSTTTASRSDEMQAARGRTTRRSSAVVITGAARGIGAEAARQLHARGARRRAGRPRARRAASARGRARRRGAAAFEADVTDWDALAGGRRRDGRALRRDRRRDRQRRRRHRSATVGASTRTRSSASSRSTCSASGGPSGPRCPTSSSARGYVLPVASLAAALHVPMMARYAAAKAGAEAFADSLRRRSRHTGTTVGCAYFGFIDTDMVRDGFEHPAAAARRAGRARGHDRADPAQRRGRRDRARGPRARTHRLRAALVGAC